MKGRYGDCRMTIYGAMIPKASSIVHWSKKVELLTKQAKQRLKICDWHHRHNKNISLTARHFQLTRKTVRKYLKRLSVYGPRGLLDQSRRPIHRRKPSTPRVVVLRVVRERRQYPGFSKYKLAAIMKYEKVRYQNR